jgi:hypothetical protein
MKGEVQLSMCGPTLASFTPAGALPLGNSGKGESNEDARQMVKEGASPEAPSFLGAADYWPPPSPCT